MPASDYIIIAGHGRSGSNRILDVFDRHPNVFCRNEPNAIPGSLLHALPPGMFPSGDARFVDKWRAAIDGASGELSVRDRIGDVRKTYVDFPTGLLGQVVLPRQQGRRLFSAFAPSLRNPVWPATALGYANPHKLRDACPVLKILLCPGWILDVFDHEPRMRVILNVRAPKPFLRSWRHRYVGEHAPPETVFRHNSRSLERILTHFGRTDASLDAFSEENLLKSELWRWRYVNETLYRAFSGHARFNVVTYEEFDANPLETAEALFAFAGLAMDDGVKRRISGLKNELFKGKPPAGQSDSLVEDVIADVLAGSPLTDLWP